MKRMAWQWALAASAMALAFAACTVTSDDGDEDAGTSGSGGGTAGTGGSTAGTGGSAGVAGSAGSAGTAGSSGTKTCGEIFSDTTDTCQVCFVTNCCAAVEACYNEAGETAGQCLASWDCYGTDCADPNNLPEGVTYEECKANCDDGNYNEAYSDMVVCLENSCYNDCTVTQ